MTGILLGTYQWNVNGCVKIKTVWGGKNKKIWKRMKLTKENFSLYTKLYFNFMVSRQNLREVKRRGEDWRGAAFGLILAALFASEPCHRGRMRSWGIFGITTCMLNGIPPLKIFFALSEGGRSSSCKVRLASCRLQSLPSPLEICARCREGRARLSKWTLSRGEGMFQQLENLG